MILSGILITTFFVVIFLLVYRLIERPNVKKFTLSLIVFLWLLTILSMMSVLGLQMG
jgi:hypothetical protein